MRRSNLEFDAGVGCEGDIELSGAGARGRPVHQTMLAADAAVSRERRTVVPLSAGGGTTERRARGHGTPGRLLQSALVLAGTTATSRGEEDQSHDDGNGDQYGTQRHG